MTSNVDGGGGDLRSVIAAATAGDTITFDPALDGQTMVLTNTIGQLTIGIDLTLDASALPNGFTIDAGGRSRCLEIAGGAVVEISKLTFTGGLPSQGGHGGGILNGGDLTLREVHLVGNATADRSGTGGEAFEGGRGGGIYTSSGSLVLEDCEVAGNATGSGSSGQVGRGGGGDGGGIALRGVGSLTLRRCRVVNNRTGEGGAGFSGGCGAGIYYLASGFVVIEDTLIRGNRCGDAGDGILDGGRFEGGDGSEGGGIFVDGFSQFTLLRSTVAENRAGDGGDGAVGASERGGFAGQGGGLYLSLGVSSLVQIDASTICDNQAGKGGDGSNPAGLGGSSSGGGGVAFRSSSALANVTVVHSTITGNRHGGAGKGGDSGGRDGTASGAAGMTGLSGVNLQLRNTIVRDNTSSLGPSDLSGDFAIEGINLLDPGGIDGAISGTGTYLDLDPQLTPLGDHGGWTPTRVPFIGSPVVNAGAPLDDGAGMVVSRTGQRGIMQIDDPDIGAVESQDVADLPLLWDQDWDGDGLSYGVERAIGTNPTVADFDNPRRLQPPIVNGEVTLEFGISPGAGAESLIIVERSTDPHALQFEEVFRYDTSADTETLAPGIGFEFTPRFAPNRIRLTDSTVEPRGFYRLRVDLITP